MKIAPLAKEQKQRREARARVRVANKTTDLAYESSMHFVNKSSWFSALKLKEITGLEFVPDPHNRGGIRIEVNLALGGREVYGVYENYAEARKQLTQLHKKYELV